MAYDGVQNFNYLFFKKHPSRHAISREYSLNNPSSLQCSLIHGTFREHFKGKGFLKVLHERVVFVLEVYDLVITNVDLFANSSNHKVMFPEYSRNIPRMSVSKSFQGYTRNILRLWKCLWGVEKLKKLFFGLCCEVFNICSLIS